MKVAIPIAGYHPGTTGEYVYNAFNRLGHETQILNKEDFYKHAAENTFELFFCVDSGETFDFSLLPQQPETQICMWFIDYRHNKERSERSPNDLNNSLELLNRGGVVFQAQYEDVVDLKSRSKNENIAWIPIAADPYIWNNLPQEDKRYDIGFVGNIWDKSRAKFLEWMINSGLKVGFKGHGAVWKEDAAKLLRECKVGFNISTLYGSSVAYDLNMRFFETLSCGVPLITNWIPSIDRLFKDPLPFIHTYRSPEEFTNNLNNWLREDQFINSGSIAREFIINNHTYEHRVRDALAVLGTLKSRIFT